MNASLRSTIQLLRFHFSIFLMPVYWFALSQLVDIDINRAILIFIILHLLIYPASNGYNSYMDRDTSSIGGLKDPLPPTRQLFYVTIIMDFISIILSSFLGWRIIAGIIIYILASRAYSFRGIRIKQYPIAGFLLVVICQGALVFYVTYIASSAKTITTVPLLPLLASSALIGGFYPLTQIYQYESDRNDHVQTISMLLGYRGTFIFTGIVYAISFILLAFTFFSNLEFKQFLILQIFMIPVFVYYFRWFRKVWRDTAAANFRNAMNMNILASLFTNLGFITVLIMNRS